MSKVPEANRLVYWDGCHAVYLSERYGQSQKRYRIVHVPSGHEQTGSVWGGYAWEPERRVAKDLLNPDWGTAISAPIDEDKAAKEWNQLDHMEAGDE